jgi:chromosome segregation ATPase
MAKQDDLALAEGSPLSRTQQISQYEKKLGNVRDELEAKESELEAIRLRLTDAEKGWTKSKAEADALRAQIAGAAGGFVGIGSTDEDRVMSRLTERMRAIVGAEMASLRRNEKSRESI